MSERNPHAHRNGHRKSICIKNSYFFRIKTLRKLGIKGNFLIEIKGIYEKPTANIKLNGERVKAFPL